VYTPQRAHDHMLQLYYGNMGWDNRGIPTRSTLVKLGLGDVSQELEGYIRLVA
jgi:aldehyde:ferredoxin oxidoreductase